MPGSPLDSTRLYGLVVRWQKGDRGAADELCRLAARRLEFLARRLLQGFPRIRVLAATDDVLQAALVRLLRSLEEVTPGTARDFFNLAAAHIRRELLDLTRRAAARPDLAGPSGDLDNVPCPDADPAELERWCDFHRAVEQLPAEQREVVSLTFYHGWSQARIAELHQVNVRTVRRWWAAACDRLRTALDGRFPQLPG